jgi:hypothetical protein
MAEDRGLVSYFAVFVVSPVTTAYDFIGQHAIKHQRCTLRDALLCDFDTIHIAVRDQLHDRPLRPHEIRGAVLEPTQREQLAAFG